MKKHARMILALVLLPLPIAWLTVVAAVGVYRSVTWGNPSAFVVGCFAAIAAGCLIVFAYRTLP